MNNTQIYCMLVSPRITDVDRLISATISRSYVVHLEDLREITTTGAALI